MELACRCFDVQNSLINTGYVEPLTGKSSTWVFMPALPESENSVRYSIMFKAQQFFNGTNLGMKGHK